VQERGELLLLPLPCDIPHTLQRLGHAFPDLRPARALLARVPLGPCTFPGRFVKARRRAREVKRSGT